MHFVHFSILILQKTCDTNDHVRKDSNITSKADRSRLLARSWKSNVIIGNVIIANSSKQINATEENEILYTNAESPIKTEI